MAEKPEFPDSMTPLQRLLRRRRFLIHKKLQYKLLLGTFWHLVLVGVMVIAVLFLPLVVQLSTNDPRSDVALGAANHLLYLHGRFWPAFVLVSVLIGLDALRTSHRIAGPILRFHRVLQDIRAGRVPQTIALRKGDFFLDECAELNAAILESGGQADRAGDVSGGTGRFRRTAPSPDGARSSVSHAQAKPSSGRSVDESRGNS